LKDVSHVSEDNEMDDEQIFKDFTGANQPKFIDNDHSIHSSEHHSEN